MTGSPSTRRLRRPPALVLVPLALVVVALAAATLTFLPPPAEPQPSSGAAAPFSPPAARILVNVHLAGPGPATVGLPIQIAAAALGRTGIAGLELWVGGDRVELLETADPARPAATARWEWIPSEPGETILVARAFDADGRTAQSAPVRVTVTEHPPRSYLLVPVSALAGETLDELVDRVGGDRLLAHYLHPELVEGPVPEGSLIDIPRFEGAAAPAAWTPLVDSGATRERARELTDAILAANLDAILPAGLATPVVDVQVDPDCTVTATASGGGSGADGYAFLALPPIGETFLQLPPVAPAPDGSATTSFAALGGTNYLYVASYTEDASATSAIVPLAVPDDCAAAGWEGDARLDGGSLVVDGQADRAYLYLKVGDGSWQRLPAGAGSFVEAVDGAFEFGALLPAIAGKDLGLEAWGWLDGSLVKLGRGSYTAPKQQLYGGGLVFGAGDPILGFGTTLDIVAVQGGGEILEQLAKHSVVDLPGPNSTSGQRHFKWSTTVPGVTHLVWQVLPYPLGPSSTTLTPPFLIDTDTIEVGGASGGYFSLDLKPYLLDADGSSGVWSTTLMTEQLISQVLLGNPYLPAPTGGPPPEAIVLPGELWWPKPSGGTTTQGPPQLGDATLQDLAFLAPLPSTLYVRVIPFFGAIPMPNASNVVSFDVVEPSDPVYIDTSPPPPPPTYPDAYKLVKAAFFGPTGSNQAYARCVKVVKGGKTVYDPIYVIFGGSNWNNGTTHCAPPPDDDDGWSLSDAFDSFASWVGDVWDFVAEGYTWMQDKVVQAVLAVVPCEQFTSKDTCEKIAHTALQAALASFGLPPEIPNWESTIAAAKGDLKTFILENAEAIPGVGDACTAAAIANQASSSVPTCEQVVDKAVNAAIEEVVKERSSAAAQNAGVLVPPGITVEPDPRSMAQPPHFEVTLQRTNLPLPADAVCTLYGSMTSVVENWTWKEYQWIEGNPKVVTKGPAQVSGEPFMAKKQIIAPLAPGQTVTYEVWLTKSIVWFEPDGWNDHYAEQYYEWNGQHNRVWVLLQQGATVTGTLSSNCAPGGQSIQVLTGSAYS